MRVWHKWLMNDKHLILADPWGQGWWFLYMSQHLTHIKCSGSTCLMNDPKLTILFQRYDAIWMVVIPVTSNIYNLYPLYIWVLAITGWFQFLASWPLLQYGSSLPPSESFLSCVPLKSGWKISSESQVTQNHPLPYDLTVKPRCHKAVRDLQQSLGSGWRGHNR